MASTCLYLNATCESLTTEALALIQSSSGVGSDVWAKMLCSHNCSFHI